MNMKRFLFYVAIMFGSLIGFCAAEIVLRKDIINETKYLSNLVKQLAADAYRQYVLTGF